VEAMVSDHLQVEPADRQRPRTAHKAGATGSASSSGERA
jgi:hypothetical protein